MDLTYKEQNTNSSEILYNCELIASTFADALKQNNCMLMLTVGLHQELNDAIKDLEDISKTIDSTDKELNDLEESLDQTILDSVQSIINDSKANCYSCKLSMPELEFNFDLNAILGRLQALFNMYTDMFKVGKLDLCQAAYSIRNSCLPDILKLIILLLTAYASIMMLKNISSISLLAFIKGVLQTLISKIFSSLKISVGIGSTNISCIISAFKEIAESLVPTNERIIQNLDRESQLALGIVQETDHSPLYNQYVEDLDKGINRVTKEASELDTNIEKLETQLNETFSKVSEVLTSSTKEVNDYIANLLGLKTSFECESKRSGTDVSDVMMKVNNLIQVLNLLSAVAVAIAKKEARDRICSTGQSINNMSTNDVSDVQMKDIVEEYYQKEAEIIENEDNGIQIIIYDKPKPSVLPKLDLLDCSINDFTMSHTIDNIIKVTEDVVREELDRPTRPTTSTDGNTNTYVITKPPINVLNNIDNIMSLLYDEPNNTATDIISDLTSSLPSDTVATEEILNPIGKGGFEINTDMFNTNNKDSSLNCRSIEDVMTVLKSLRS